MPGLNVIALMIFFFVSCIADVVCAVLFLICEAYETITELREKAVEKRRVEELKRFQELGNKALDITEGKE